MHPLLKKAILKVYFFLRTIVEHAMTPVATTRKIYLKLRGYNLNSYTDAQGRFDYERYRKIQEEGNIRKIDLIAAKEELIAFLADYMTNTRGMKVRFGICHGTRRGMEQKWFRQHLGDAEVIGTEISSTAIQFENTIQWDFHQVKPEWLGAVDFIYSNSWDHSYDPKHCFSQWVSCLKPDGICILEHSIYHGPEYTDDLDPFGANLPNLVTLINTWGEGKFHVDAVLDNDRHATTRHVIVTRTA